MPQQLRKVVKKKKKTKKEEKKTKYVFHKGKAYRVA